MGIDDEQSILQSMGILIRTGGHEVSTARDGTEAEQLIKEEPFDLLITDIRMTPMDGMELLKRANKLRPEMPVIVISAYGSEKTEQQSYESGCVAYIKKPFKVQEVLDAVSKALA